MKNKDIKCPSCGRIGRVMSYRSFIRLMALLLLVVGIVLLPLIVLCLPISIGMVAYSFFIDPSKKICQYCKFTSSLWEMA